MTSISRIVCAVDIDDSARTAFGQALAIARAHNATLLLVCPTSPGQPFSRRETERVAYLMKIRREAEAANVDVRADVQTGEAAEIILLHAAAREADLVVISVEHGRGDGRRWGAIAEDVLRGAPCPTLIVPAGSSNQSTFSRIVCAVDPKDDSPMTIDRALPLIDGADRTVTVTHVETGAVAPQLIATARAANADLLVIGGRRRNRVGQRLFGITHGVLTNSRCPVLALPLEPRAIRREERRAA